ncbi:MatE_and transmembrane domain-containing protein [Hexamita inflata]|uniref:MatE_and transmembrane domain-containing protein n=1 Tax=Hexamita inflata TaxID=28002 RepID=A0ABP1HT16_9EUKA
MPAESVARDPSTTSYGTQQTSGSSFLVNQQQKVQTLVMGELTPTFLKLFSIHIIPQLVEAISPFIQIQMWIYYLGYDTAASLQLLSCLQDVSFRAISMAASQSVGIQIEKHLQLQQTGACSIMFTYGLLVQLTLCLLVGAILSAFANSFIPNLSKAYMIIQLILSPITYTMAHGFRRILEAENYDMIAHCYTIVQHLGQLVLQFVIFLILSVSKKQSINVVAGSQLAIEVMLMVMTLVLMNTKFIKMTALFKISHIKDFKIQLVWKVLKPTLIQIWFEWQDQLIFFPAAMLCIHAEQDVLRILMFKRLAILSSCGADAAELLTRTYSRVNLQVQRFDRLFIIVGQTLFAILGISFIIASVVLTKYDTFTRYTLILLPTSFDTKLLRIAAIRGFMRPFRMVQWVASADNAARKTLSLVSLKFLQVFVQVIVFAFRPIQSDFLFMCVYTEIFNGVFDVLLYPLYMKMFLRYRKQMAEVTDHVKELVIEPLAPPPLMDQNASSDQIASKSNTKSKHDTSNDTSNTQKEIVFEHINMMTVNHQTFENYIRDSSTNGEHKEQSEFISDAFQNKGSMSSFLKTDPDKDKDKQLDFFK